MIEPFTRNEEERVRQDIQYFARVYGYNIPTEFLDKLVELIDTSVQESYEIGWQENHCGESHCSTYDHKHIENEGYSKGREVGHGEGYKLAIEESKHLSVEQQKILVPRMDKIMNTMVTIDDALQNKPKGFYGDYDIVKKIYRSQNHITQGDLKILNDMWIKYKDIKIW